MHVIAGSLKGRRLECPKGLDVRPTSSMLRETLFNIIQMQIPSAKFLDLYAGTGAVGIEAISRGASEVVFIDHSAQAIQYIKKNLERLGVTEEAKVIVGDAPLIIKKILREQEPFDMIYIDPPYKLFEDEGYISSLMADIVHYHILKKGGLVFVESRMEKKGHPQEKNFEGFVLEKIKKAGSSQLAIYRLI